MRASILAALLAACLAHVAIAVSAAPRRSLAVVDPFSSDPLQDRGMCWESIRALCSCKHNLLESFLTGRPVPLHCCEAAGEIDIFCDLFTSGLVGALIPRGLRKQCDATLRDHIGGGGARAPPAPEESTTTSVRFPPPRASTVSGGGSARAPPEESTSVRFSPPPASTVSGGGSARASPAPKESTSVRFPPPRSSTVSGGGARSPPAPEAYTSVGFPPPRTARVSGGDTRTPSSPDAYASVSSPPPRTTRVSGGGARAPPTPEAHITVSSSPSPRAARVSGGGARAPTTPEARTSVSSPPPRAHRVSGGGALAPARSSASVSPPSATRASGGGARLSPTPKVNTTASFPPPPATRVSGGGARGPATPEAHASVSSPPPRANRASSGRTTPPPPDVITGFYFPPPIPGTEYHGAHAASPGASTGGCSPPLPPAPKVSTSTGSTHAPVVAGTHDPVVHGVPAAPGHGVLLFDATMDVRPSVLDAAALVPAVGACALEDRRGGKRTQRGGSQMEKEVEVHGEGEMEDIHGEGEVDSVHVEGEVEGEVDAVQVEEDGDVEMTQGQVQELEDEFQMVHKNIEDLFDKVDRATNVEATDARILARYVHTANLVQDVVHRTYSNPTSTCEVCIHLALCLKCGIRGEPSIFLCLGCRLPVPKDLRSCEACVLPPPLLLACPPPLTIACPPPLPLASPAEGKENGLSLPPMREESCGRIRPTRRAGFDGGGRTGLSSHEPLMNGAADRRPVKPSVRIFRRDELSGSSSAIGKGRGSEMRGGTYQLRDVVHAREETNEARWKHITRISIERYHGGRVAGILELNARTRTDAVARKAAQVARNEAYRLLRPYMKDQHRKETPATPAVMQHWQIREAMAARRTRDHQAKRKNDSEA
ncbi:hypothetical protein QYE76_045831 [Lolium multiflorum]|uniref:Uncharacterized protein n=1 Tax=Lolium multiflorum TaxID=4521 RepID=A0AAD8TNR2_LOLMU|nr:hypothetical protein QYE76_045831 [Lolium multiflorum]